MKIDVFPFYNELDMLDFRLHHVYDHVDKIVIVEGDRTLAGVAFNSFFDANSQRYAWARDKIVRVSVALKENPSDRWENEAILHDGMLDGLELAPDDVVFLTVGVDEIIRHEYYDGIVAPVEVCMSLDNYYYYFNGRDVGDNPAHPMPMVFNYGALDTNIQTYWEKRHSFLTIEHAGWHFSYLGGIEQIKQKLAAYAHAENDVDGVKNSLEANIASGKDIFGRPDHKFEYVPIDNTFPDELVNNQVKYKALIHET